ncbi:competence protein [Malaciobacter mytili]|uniref:ComEC/Rec2 family competence protein n=1 Tax=Malaciobacter mytili TaxID=603050 RepID=UPI00100A8FAE|nr:ComEC/Rec2 family competence protein [Malaciobacter mytili]RXI45420.1 competence protein [Malaciobacter mytili]
MKTLSLELVKTKIELFYLSCFLVLIFLINIFYEYAKYKDITYDEVYSSEAVIVNIYKKENIVKFNTGKFIFYSKINSLENLKKFDRVRVLFISKYISFYSYLKGFYTKVLDLELLEKQKSIKANLILKIQQQHQDKAISELFLALFLAIPASIELKEFFANFSISHLIAISGFHLAILSFIIYSFSFFFYSFYHQKYFNYRNKKYDILLFTSFIIFLYLLLTDIVASLLRSYIMFIIGIFLLRNNIKLLSFNSLLLTVFLILAFFPKYLFSLSLWFSISAVFYIFLFIKYFKDLNKVFSFFFFNLWIFLVFNPIVHLFFYQTSLIQFYSILLTMIFTIFYPLELFLHFIGLGNLLDEYIKSFLELKFIFYEVKTPFWFFLLYCVISLCSSFKKQFFWILNILMVGFNLYLYI